MHSSTAEKQHKQKITKRWPISNKDRIKYANITQNILERWLPLEPSFSTQNSLNSIGAADSDLEQY